MTAPTTTTTLSPELKGLLRRVKLGKTLDTLPERLTLARTSKRTHAEFLELVLADEVTRRDAQSSTLRARTAKLDPAMTLEAWDGDANVTYDQHVWSRPSRWCTGRCAIRPLTWGQAASGRAGWSCWSSIGGVSWSGRVRAATSESWYM